MMNEGMGKTMNDGARTADASLPALLRHRGLSRRRAAALMVDLSHGDVTAIMELDVLLPTNHRAFFENGALEFSAILTPRAFWQGDHLELRMEVPETLRAAMPGRNLNDVVGHPALPDRPVTRVGDIGVVWLVLHVDADERPLDEMAGRARLARLLGPARRAIRRRRFDIASRNVMGREFALAIPWRWKAAALAASPLTLAATLLGSWATRTAPGLALFIFPIPSLALTACVILERWTRTDSLEPVERSPWHRARHRKAVADSRME